MGDPAQRPFMPAVRGCRWQSLSNDGKEPRQSRGIEASCSIAALWRVVQPVEPGRPCKMQEPSFQTDANRTDDDAAGVDCRGLRAQHERQMWCGLRLDARWSWGDVIRLRAGDLVPANSCLITADDLHVQQAALTGESRPSEKMPSDGPVTVSGADAPSRPPWHVHCEWNGDPQAGSRPGLRRRSVTFASYNSVPRSTTSATEK